jgi:hypothetical protein
LPNDLNNILEFISNLFTLGKAYRTINVARSMLSGTLFPIEGQPVVQHCLVMKLVKGIYNSKPLESRYSSTWSIDLATVYFYNFPFNSESVRYLP